MVAHQKPADYYHQDKAWQYYGHGCHARAQDAGPCRISGIDYGSIPDVGSRVNAYRPRSHLAYGDNIGKLSCSQPVMVVDDVALYHRQHCVSTSEAKQAYLEESDEKLQENHDAYFINCPYVYPPNPANITTYTGETPNSHIAMAETMGIHTL